MDDYSKLQQHISAYGPSFESQRRNIGFAHQLKNQIIALSKKGIKALKENSQIDLTSVRFEIIDSWNKLISLDIPEDLKWQLISESGQELVEFFSVSIFYPALFSNEEPDTDSLFSVLPSGIKPQIMLAGLGDSVSELGKCLNDYLLNHEDINIRVGLRRRFCFFAENIHLILDQHETAYALVIDNTRRPGYGNSFRGLLGRITNVINHEKEKLIFEQNLQIFLRALEVKRNKKFLKRRLVMENRAEVVSDQGGLVNGNRFLTPEAFKAWSVTKDIPWGVLRAHFSDRPQNGGQVTLAEYEAVRPQLLPGVKPTVSFLVKEGYGEWHRRGGAAFISKRAIIQALGKNSDVGFDELLQVFEAREKFIDRQKDGEEIECKLCGQFFQPTTFLLLSDNGTPTLYDQSPIRVGDFRGLEEEDKSWTKIALCPCCHYADKDLRQLDTFPSETAENFVNRQNDTLKKREERGKTKEQILRSAARENFRRQGYKVS